MTFGFRQNFRLSAMAFGFRQCLSAFEIRLSAFGNDFRRLPKAESFAESHFSCSVMTWAKRLWECFRECYRKLQQLVVLLFVEMARVRTT